MLGGPICVAIVDIVAALTVTVTVTVVAANELRTTERNRKVFSRPKIAPK